MKLQALRSLILTVAFIGLSSASDTHPPTPAERGYRFLTEKPYLPPDFDQETFDSLWKVWPEPLRAKAEKASFSDRRSLAFSRYGLTGRPDDPTKPLQYVVDEAGNWTMNCFACHGGKILGKTHPGLPNSHYALETLTADARKLKLMTGKPLTRMDVGSMIVPLGKTNGTTNAVMFGVALMAYRDAELNYHAERSPPKMIHHDMDAPAWWQFKKKTHIYIDAFAEKGHRALMQFMLVKENGPEDFKAWESNFKDVYAFLESVEPPEYPFTINSELAAQGQLLSMTTAPSVMGRMELTANIRIGLCQSTKSEPTTYVLEHSRHRTELVTIAVGLLILVSERRVLNQMGTLLRHLMGFGPRRPISIMDLCLRFGM